MNAPLLLSVALAGYLYVISPGPAFLALFTLTAARGRGAGARFIGGHLVGDVTWGGLAVAAIMGATRLGSTLFDTLGLVAGLYLIYLGVRAVRTRADVKPRAIGAQRPLLTGLAFGLTNPKAYPVALAMVSAMVAPYAQTLSLADAPRLIVAALLGFLTADATLIAAAGLPTVRRFFLTHGVIVTRAVGLLFIALGVRSVAHGAAGLSRR